ncbi:MAG TPA: NAD(P)-binding domain-containing protein [Solirubrobacterales bacterium]|nr:NAD(P)-binding domain-containing protein [Solirubrobacterales bacterium]
MESPKSRACVIGAGIAGLAACQALRARGIEFQCFEAGDDVGGLWHFEGSTAPTPAYRSVHTISSRRTFGFRRFPMPDDYPDFPGQRLVMAYLRDYAEHFDLRRSIRFGARVTSAERLPGGGWRVQAEGCEPAGFDVLLSASGHLTEPVYPDFPGAFEGETIHARDYMDPTDPLDLRGKRVLVVGIGNTAVDIASELSRTGVAESVILSTRSSAWVVPKYTFGVPSDRVFRLLMPALPLRPQLFVAGRLLRLLSGGPARFGLPAPNHGFLEAHPTLSSDLLLRLGHGAILARPDVAALRGDRVRFTDGSEEQIDAIVYATGYRAAVPFLAPEIFAPVDGNLPLYLRTFKPGVDDLAFIGFAEGVPSQPVFDELQAELVAMWLSGEWTPPQPFEMEREIATDQRRFSHYRKEHLVPVYERELRHEAIPAGRRRAARPRGVSRGA